MHRTLVHTLVRSALVAALVVAALGVVAAPADASQIVSTGTGTHIRLGVNAKTVGHAIRKMQRTRAA